MEWAKRWGVIIVPGIAGMVIFAYGLWEVIKPREPVVEIIKNEQRASTEIVVDVAGAVEKPGIYKLTPGARIGDALVAAGGLSASANREWVAQNLNLAEEVKDGKKVYIPGQADLPAGRQITQSSEGSKKLENQRNGKINLNTASQQELESLTGIGEARAKAIIANRFYADMSEIIGKAKIPQSVYEQIKTHITVY